MSKRKALVTGVDGQNGFYMSKFLLERGYEVHGSTVFSECLRGSLRKSYGMMPKIGLLQKTGVILHWGNLSDFYYSDSMEPVIKEVMPDEVYNFGARTHVGDSFNRIRDTFEITGLGPIKLLESLRHLKPNVKFFQPSSAEMFGEVLETPQNETTPFNPQSPYAKAKVYSYFKSREYREKFGMFVSNGIFFNHESEKRPEDFVTRKITRKLADIKTKKLHLLLKDGLRNLNVWQPVLELGNLDAKRDWGYAPDYMEVVWQIMQHHKADDFVVGTGETHSVREFLEESARVMGLNIHSNRRSGLEEKYLDKDEETVVKISPDLFRPAEVNLLLANPNKIKRELGWEAKTKFKDLVGIMCKADLELAEDGYQCGGKIEKYFNFKSHEGRILNEAELERHVDQLRFIHSGLNRIERELLSCE